MAFSRDKPFASTNTRDAHAYNRTSLSVFFCPDNLRRTLSSILTNRFRSMVKCMVRIIPIVSRLFTSLTDSFADSNLGKTTDGLGVRERHGLGAETLQFVANILSGGLSFGFDAGVAHGEEEVFRQTVNLAQPPDGGNPGVAVAINVGRHGFVHVERFDGFAWCIPLKMHKRQNNVVIVITDALVLFVKTREVHFLQKISQATPHDNFLILAVTGELPFDVKIKQLRQFGFGVIGQHGADFAEMEQAFARPHQLREGGNANLRLGTEHKLLGFFIPPGHTRQLLQQAAQTGFEDIKVQFGEKIGDALVLPALKVVAEKVQLRAEQNDAHIDEFTGFAVRAKTGNGVVANKFIHAASQNLAESDSNRHSIFLTDSNVTPVGVSVHPGGISAHQCSSSCKAARISDSMDCRNAGVHAARDSRKMCCDQKSASAVLSNARLWSMT